MLEQGPWLLLIETDYVFLKPLKAPKASAAQHSAARRSMAQHSAEQGSMELRPPGPTLRRPAAPRGLARTRAACSALIWRAPSD